jgi:phosphatidylglycerophosphate synthase
MARTGRTIDGPNGRGNRARGGTLVDAYRAARAGRVGGFLCTTHVNERLASSVAALAIKWGVHPSVISVLDLLVAVAGSAYLIAAAGDAHQFWVAGLVACVCWQISYILDCADGQVARATGKSSDYGARVDVLVDFFVHCVVIAALLAVIAEVSPIPAAVAASIAGMWMVNLIIGVLTRTDGNLGHSFTSGGRVVEVFKLIRDTGFVLFVIGCWVWVDPDTVIFPVLAVTAFNVLFLIASIAREVYLSMRASGRRQ